MNDHSEDGATGRSARGGPLGSDDVALTPSMETVFEVLADETRREICRFLVAEAPAVVTADEIAASLADDEAAKRRVALNCHHRHLPKLDEAGLIEYDARSNTVRYWGQPTLEKWLEHVSHVDDRPEPAP
jgi:DNA-binding transcriptional ArsR family regulator